MNTDEQRLMPSVCRGIFAAALVTFGITCIVTASVSFGEPDERNQETNSTAINPTEEKNELLKKNQASLKKSRIYTFVEKTGLGHRHGVEGQLKSGLIEPGADQDAGELVFDMTSFDADTDAARKHLGLEGSTDSSTREQVNANMKNTSVLIRLSRIHDQEREIVLKKMSGTLEASEHSAKPDAGEFQTPFSTNLGQLN